MTAACRTIHAGRFIVCGYFYIAFSALILVFTDLGKQIPIMTAAGRAINYIWAFGSTNHFSAFPAMVYIFSCDSEIDPIMAAAG